jgi:tetratricopeptide (TPR) repeat protein
MSMSRGCFSSLALLLLSLLAIPVEGSSDPAVLLSSIVEPRLDPDRAVSIEKVELNVGPATLHLEAGVLVPVVAEGVGPVELVFLGQGRIEMEAPDKIEAGQLELFTGAPRLDQSFEGAVLVSGSGVDVDALLERPALPPDASLRQRADTLWTAWRKSREREIFHVDRSLLLDALRDPVGDGFFGAWLRSEDLGDFVYFVEPGDPEQVRLGQFIVLDLTERERRRKERAIRSEQREGRALGVEVDDLGTFNTWALAALRSSSGDPTPGSPAFKPTRYTLETRLTQPGLRLSGKARIDFETMVRGSRVVGLSLPGDFQVERVTDAQGRPLFFRREEDDLTVILPQAPADGEAVAVTVEYAGNPVAKDWNLTALLETERWYPRIALMDRATYDATFHWPGDFDLVASGRRVDGGQEADGTRWERRVLDIPSRGFSFEIGHFDLQTARTGHIQVTFAFGPGANLTSRASKQEVMNAVTDALAFFEETFGPYPLDELTVSTVPRGISQGLLGFVTISDLYLSRDRGIWNRYFGVEDRRLVIAHEVAHQWWGGLLGWASYRDQWIGEALAEYSASLYGTKRLRGELSGVDSTASWRQELARLLRIGRPVESLGPIVLGRRLDSSLSGDAYRLIAYKKGAVIVDMLAGLVGEEKLPQALRQVAQMSAGKRISTRDLLALLEQVTAAELEGFAERFIYGTGLPRVLYSYRWERQGEAWVIKGTINQLPPHYRRFKVARTARGTFDVPGEAVPQADVRRSAVVVPLEIEVFDPAQKPGTGREGANRIVRANFQLRGVSGSFSLPVAYEPKALWLDREGQVFGLFFDASRYPKQAAYLQARAAADAGRLEEANELFVQARAMDDEPPPEAPPGRTIRWKDIQKARRHFNADIEGARALLLMDMDRDAEAEEVLGRVRQVLWNDAQGSIRLDRMQARLAVRQGHYDRAWELLRKIERLEGVTAQEQALLAIAARETGHMEEFLEARRRALRMGVEVGPAAK